ncbi:hypothetical protein Br6_05069 [Rhodococcus sp. Br-6]|nr:hypothetical protein C8K36_1271 [Rhodococcus sp. OK519]GBF17662.1 hypothetical protein Br6_05069 [Rhodococcus sp. Br-6]
MLMYAIAVQVVSTGPRGTVCRVMTVPRLTLLQRGAVGGDICSGSLAGSSTQEGAGVFTGPV